MGESEDLTCDYTTLMAQVALGKACEFVREYCSEDVETINFYTLRYCTLPAGWGGTFLLFVLAITFALVCFFLLGNIAATYLTPVLTKVSLALNMSETLSGVTLLAFANGAPDIISSFSAGGSEGGLYISIGNLFGAGLFCSTLVIGRCIQVSKNKVVMEKDQWNRDLIFYIVAGISLLVFGMVGYINYYMIAGFGLIYVVYLAVVIYQDKKSREEQGKSDLRNSELHMKHDNDEHKLKEKMHKYMNNEPIEDTPGTSMIEDTQDPPQVRKLTLTMAEVKKIYKDESEDVAKEQDTENPILKWLTLPLAIVPKLTIPNLEEEEVVKPIAALMPVTSILVIAFFTSGLDLTKPGRWVFNFTAGWYVMALLIGVPVAGLVFHLQKQGKQVYQWILVPFALVASILWLKSSAGCVVDIINFVSDNYDVNKVLLGATLLGIGNTLADFFANSSLAALGYGVMACTGSIAGQLFNLLMSIPLNIFNSLNSSGKSSEEFDLYDFSGKDKTTKIFAVVLIFLVILQLVNIMYMSIFNNYVLTMKLAKVNLVVYGVCFVGFFILEYAIPKDAIEA